MFRLKSRNVTYLTHAAAEAAEAAAAEVAAKAEKERLALQAFSDTMQDLSKGKLPQGSL